MSGAPATRAAREPRHKIKPGGLSKSDHERIFELADKGWKASRIALSIEKNPGTVRWFMYRNGLAAPAYGRASSTRGGRLVKPFTPEEDEEMVGLRVEGHGPTHIADVLTKRFGHPRSMHTIACRLVMVAARDSAQ